MNVERSTVGMKKSHQPKRHTLSGSIGKVVASHAAVARSIPLR